MKQFIDRWTKPCMFTYEVHSALRPPEFFRLWQCLCFLANWGAVCTAQYKNRYNTVCSDKYKYKRPAVCAAKYNLFAISVQAQHAVLIGTGIGVTPYASILQSIMHRWLEVHLARVALSLSGLSINRHLVEDAELLILIDQYFLQILGGEEHLSEVLLQMDKRPLQPGAAVLSTSRDICISPLPPIWWQSEGGVSSPLENGLKRLWYKGDELAESWLLLDQQRTAQLWMVKLFLEILNLVDDQSQNHWDRRSSKILSSGLSRCSLSWRSSRQNKEGRWKGENDDNNDDNDNNDKGNEEGQWKYETNRMSLSKQMSPIWNAGSSTCTCTSPPPCRRPTWRQLGFNLRSSSCTRRFQITSSQIMSVLISGINRSCQSLSYLLKSCQLISRMPQSIKPLQSKRDLITGLKTRTIAGRPNWDKVFRDISNNRFFLAWW